MDIILPSNQEFVKCKELPRKIISKVPENKQHTRFVLVDKYIETWSNNERVKIKCMILTDKENSLYYKKVCLNNLEEFTHCKIQCVEKLPANACPMRGERAVSSLRLGPNTPNDTTANKGEFLNKKEKYTIGIDSEWVEVNGVRHVLSYQLSMYIAGGSDGEGELIEFILFPDGHRLKLGKLLSLFTQELRAELGIDIGASASNEGEKAVCYLVGHYIIADLTTFLDAKEILRGTDTVRRTQVSVEKPYFVNVYDKHGNYKQVWVIFVRDTMDLSPSGSSLDALARSMGKIKLELPEGYSKEDMRKLLQEEPEEFIMYACNDATLALDYVRTAYPMNKIPVTLGGEGASYFRKKIMEINNWSTVAFDYHFRGFLTVRDDDTRHKKLIPRPEAAMVLAAASSAYYGGRNECFMFGIHHAGEGKTWNDFDLSGAYPTAMAMLRNVDFSRVTTLTGDVIDINPLDFIFGYVSFEFPPDTMYPCLPCKDTEGRGLIFPLKGETYASAPEIYTALKMGAKLRWIQPGVKVAAFDKHDIRAALTDLLKARAEAKKMYGKGSVQEVQLKEEINSIYGKTAQGLSGKRNYSTRHDKVENTPPSNITQPVFAAMTTSIVRAIVSAAMSQLHKLGFRIASVTTDGFLTDAPEEVLNQLDLFGFKTVYEAMRYAMVSDPTMWEIKHKCKTLIMITTRGGFGIGRVGEYALPSAKAGYKPEEGFFEIYRNDPTEELSRRFLRREGKLDTYFKKLPSPKDYIRKNADGIAVIQRKRIEWEYDLKRRPNNVWVETVNIGDQTFEHLSFDTLPWETLNNFVDARGIKKAHPELYPLKSTEKANMLMAMISDKEAARKAKMLIQASDKGGIYRTAVVSYLRDLLSGREEMPSWMVGLSYSQLAEAFNERLKVYNIVLTVDDFKNAKRRSNKGRLEDSEALRLVKELLK